MEAASDIGSLVGAVVYLSHAAHSIRPGEVFSFSVQDHDTMTDRIDFICEELERLGFPSSLIIARELPTIIREQAEEHIVGQLLRPGERPMRWMAFQPLVARSFQLYANDLSGRFKDELSMKRVLMLPFEKSGYYDGSKAMFSDNVRDAFLSADHDMNEAAKCFALGRYTASVFHLMRIVEVGLNVLGPVFS